MGYKIVYGEKTQPRLRYVSEFLILVLLVIGAFLCREQWAALEQLALQLGAGENIGDAVAAFCQDVVYGG